MLDDFDPVDLKVNDWSHYMPDGRYGIWNAIWVVLVMVTVVVILKMGDRITFWLRGKIMQRGMN